MVSAVGRVCDRKAVQHPIICSESGRALVSHHSVLVFEAFSASAPNRIDTATAFLLEDLTDDCRADYRNLMAAAVRGDYDTCALYADQLKRRCAEQFKDGVLGLEHLAAVDGLCEIVARGMGVGDAPRTYHINLSVFTSLPDMWAIGQQFPIVPIQRLRERPAVDGVLSDLTCDSDGKVAGFIGGRDSLPLHELPSHGVGGYYLGMFLGGAYQEALGGLHNLFGGPSVVRVSQSDGPHCFAVTRAAPGPSCADVLRAMQHEPEVMFEVLKQRTDAGTAAALARAFGAMPYLVFDADGSAMSGGECSGMSSDSEGRPPAPPRKTRKSGSSCAASPSDRMKKEHVVCWSPALVTLPPPGAVSCHGWSRRVFSLSPEFVAQLFLVRMRQCPLYAFFYSGNK